MNMWMELLLKRYFRWTVLVVVLIFVGLGYSFLLANKISAIQTVAVSEKKQAENTLKTQKTLRDSLKVSLKKYSDIFTAPNLEKINAVLPEKAEFPTILLTVQNVVASAGYSLDAIAVSPVATSATTTPTLDTTQTQGIISQINTIPNLNAYDLSISITGPGGYNEFKKMIDAFEQSQQLFDVLSLNYSAVQASSGGTSTVAPTYALTVRTYAYSKKTP